MIKNKKKEGWYQRKPYPHFDRPLSFKNAVKFVENSDYIKEHAFYPFLAYDKKERKVKRVKERNKPNNKTRLIRYAAHLDGYIYAYYSHKLAYLYEQKLTGLGLKDCVLAYRKGIGENITFSNNAIKEIKRRGSCVALTYDVSGFYDSLDHKLLKEQWCSVLNQTRLPKDHFNIYKSLTRYSFVDRNECYEILGIKKEDFKSLLKKPLCKDAAEFRRKIRKNKLIKRNNNDYGIPQGSPLSACLSNIYMLSFDSKMQAFANEINGYYRRYCDDILWICDKKHSVRINDFLEKEIKEAGGNLSLNNDKKTETEFSPSIDGSLKSDGDLFQYLGFTFNGKNIHMRSSTMSRYHRKIIGGVKYAKFRAWRAASKEIFKRNIYNKYSHLGKNNFITYANRSKEMMKSNSIKGQIRNHMNKIKKRIGD